MPLSAPSPGNAGDPCALRALTPVPAWASALRSGPSTSTAARHLPVPQGHSHAATWYYRTDGDTALWTLGT